MGPPGEGQVPIIITAGAGKPADSGKVGRTVFISLARLLTSPYSYLWPGYSEQSSNHHVLLIILIINAKRRERLETWSKLLTAEGNGRRC